MARRPVMCVFSEQHFTGTDRDLPPDGTCDIIFYDTSNAEDIYSIPESMHMKWFLNLTGKSKVKKWTTEFGWGIPEK